MANLSDTLTYLSGEKAAIIAAKGKVDALAYEFAGLQNTNAAALAKVMTELQGIASYRETSTIDDAANAERTAGQKAVVTAVKMGQTDLAEDEAKKIWRVAALAVRPPDRQWLLCDPDGLLEEYQANLGLGSWEEFRAWIIETPIEQMGL